MKKTCFWTSYRCVFHFCVFWNPNKTPPQLSNTKSDIWHRRVPQKMSNYEILWFFLEDIEGEMMKNMFFTSVMNAYVRGKTSKFEVNSHIFVLLRAKIWVSNVSKFKEKCDIWLMSLVDSKFKIIQNHGFIVITKDMGCKESSKTTYFVRKSPGNGSQVSH